MSTAVAFSLVYLVAGLAGVATFALVWRRRSAPGGTWLALMVLATAVWALLDALELQIPTLGGKRLVAQFEYFAIVSVAPLFYHAARELAGARARLSASWLAAVWGIPALSIVMVWTNLWHGWVWARIDPPAPGSAFAIYHYGWWFWVLVAQNYVVLGAATLALIRAMRQVGRHFRAGMGLMVVTVALPWIGNILYNFKLGPWPGLNWLMLSLGLSCGLLSWVVLREGLLDILPQARGALLDVMTDAVMVIDPAGRVLLVNEAARALLDADVHRLSQAFGFPSLESIPDRWRSEVHFRHHWLDVRMSPVNDRWGRLAGRIVVARDITLQKQMQSERERLIGELQAAIKTVTKLEGLLPLCSSCHKVRDDGGYWAQIESYLSTRTGVEFTHGICPDCMTRLYPEILDDLPADPAS